MNQKCWAFCSHSAILRLVYANKHLLVIISKHRYFMLWSLIIFIWSKMASVYLAGQTTTTLLSPRKWRQKHKEEQHLTQRVHGLDHQIRKCGNQPYSNASPLTIPPNMQIRFTLTHFQSYLGGEHKPQVFQVSVLQKWLTGWNKVYLGGKNNSKRLN